MCSHRKVLENRNAMNEKEFKEVFRRLRLFPEYINDKQIKQVFQDLVMNREDQAIDALEFNEGVKKASHYIFNKAAKDQVAFNASEGGDLFFYWVFDNFIQKEMSQ